MPTRTGVPKVASQARQVLIPAEVLPNRRTCSPWATSNQRAEISTPNVWMVIRCLRRGRRLAEERTDPSGHPGACRLGRLGYRPTWVVLEVRGLVPTAASQRQVQKQALRTSRSRAPRAPGQDTGRRSPPMVRLLARRCDADRRALAVIALSPRLCAAPALASRGAVSDEACA